MRIRNVTLKVYLDQNGTIEDAYLFAREVSTGKYLIRSILKSDNVNNLNDLKRLRNYFIATKRADEHWSLMDTNYGKPQYNFPKPKSGYKKVGR